MGLFDKFKDLIADDEDDFDDYYEDDNSFAAPAKSVRETDRYEHEERPAERPSLRRQKGDRVVNIHATTQFQVVLVKPERYEEAAGIADNLNEKRTVVLNLEATSKDVARRLLDFLSGVAYANNGQIKRVANSTYIITPYNVDVMGDLIGELESNGMFI